jgi:hypothetical protein
VDSIKEFDKIAETLWDACYDATWCDFAYTGKVFDYWRLKRWYLTDEISLAAEITAPTW